MAQYSWHTENPLDCPLVHALSIVGGKWKPIVLHMLSNGVHRFGELKRAIPAVSQKVLTQQLRELEMDGVVVRHVFAEVPLRVTYELSTLGDRLVPVLDALYRWGETARLTGEHQASA